MNSLTRNTASASKSCTSILTLYSLNLAPGAYFHGTQFADNEEVMTDDPKYNKPLVLGNQANTSIYR